MDSTTIVRIVVGLLALLLYFLPSIIGRDRRNAGAIFLVNLLTGWSVIGWVVALIWALTNDPVPVVASLSQDEVQLLALRNERAKRFAFLILAVVASFL
jgi:hypothetical protein